MHNLLMDADAMYPEGFHPVRLSYKRDHSGRATYIPRSVAGVKYYFADFGISTHIPEEEPKKLVTGILGRDQQPPELSEVTPYDPFKLDVFVVGNMLQQEFCDVITSLPATPQKKLIILQRFTNTEFLRPLVQWMTTIDPEQRPTAQEVRTQWLEVRETTPPVNREWRPRPRGEHLLETAALDAMAVYTVSMHFAWAVFEKLCRR